MRKPLQIALIAGLVALAGVSAFLFTRYQSANEQLARTRMSESEVQDRYGRTIEAIAAIQDSLNALALTETGAQLAPGGPDAERRLSGPDGKQALDRIASLRTSIAQSKERIRELEANMKKSGVKVSGLERLVANLKKSVTEKEEVIAQLSDRVEALTSEVGGLNAAVAQKQDTLRTRDLQLEERRRELATVYYVMGDKGALLESGVVTSKGGVLGLGKTLVPAATPSAAAFVALDTDHERVLRIPSAKAKVLSAQPATSYELRVVEGQTELHILDPNEFRKVKQVVILTS